MSGLPDVLKDRRGVEDAMLSLLDPLVEHLLRRKILPLRFLSISVPDFLES